MMKQNRHWTLWSLVVILLCLGGCREIDSKTPPTISVEKTEYTVKPGRLLRISPEVDNADEYAVYSWKMDGRVLSHEKELIFKHEELGTYYVKFRVVTADGTAEQEIKVQVVELQRPIIALEGGDDIIMEVGEDYTFKPSIENKEKLVYHWIIDNEEVSSQESYTFSPKKEGRYFITLHTTNADGEDEMLISILVLKSVPIDIHFDYPTQSASLGRTIRIVPDLPSTRNTSFRWFVDGKEDKEQTTAYYVYTPEKLGKTTIKVIATKEKKKGENTIVVETVEKEQHFRAATPDSKKYSNKIYKFLPAPGQFVNEGYTANTLEEAAEYAQDRLKQNAYVSLGGFGGYIIAGFDHSIKNTGTYDFAIMGNSFKGSSEPGIVWVMQDENGNGLPDDNWYELKGSETGKEETIQDYEVTYFKPLTPKSNTLWVDNQGNKGEIDWLTFHQQDFYYPNWVHTPNYMLRGTRLKARTHDESGQGTYWVNEEFDWGYVDNFSPVDRLTDDDNYNAGANANYFKISNAITHDLKPIHLEYIDFIKVQTGLNVKAGWLGENSTEVFRFIDIQIKDK